MSFSSNKGFWNQSLAALSLGFGALVSTLTMGFTSPALPSMMEDPNFYITEEQGSWVGAVLPATALLGSIAAGPLVDVIGRKLLLLFSVVPFIIAWFLTAMAPTVGVVLVARAVAGVSMGAQAVTGAIYMAELIHLDLRATLGVIAGLLGTLGLMVINLAGKFLDWRDLAWFGGIVALPQLFLILLLPESPLFLVMKDRDREASKALLWLRGSQDDVEKELSELKMCLKTTNSNRESSVMDVIRPPNLWPVSVAILLMIFQQTTGISAIIFFSSSIFGSMGNLLDPSTCSVILTVINIVGTIASSYILSQYPRRRIIRYSSIIIVISLLVISTFFWIQQFEESLGLIFKAVATLPLFAMLTYICSFALGWGPLPWVFLGEGLPSKTRGIASAASVTLNWTMTFVITKTFVVGSGQHIVFFAYGLFTAVALIVMEIYLPETFGKTMMEVDQMYKDVYEKKNK